MGRYIKNMKLSFTIPTKDWRGVSWQYREDVSFRRRVYPEPHFLSKWIVMRRDPGHSDPLGPK